ncbi:hypothetical protein [Pseudodesulfovibrio pelocollis]|uniref:hypothetical protein n=1 Tax=Pseudodesulfovibrio pelocollis TaxID=3051432 RepID=UPI00255AB8B5|nr:hypothetical protein [Pseudodesulfovibrio sp. SB368]
MQDIRAMRRERVAEVIRRLLPENPESVLGRDIMAVVDHGLPVNAQFVSAAMLNRYLAWLGLTRVECGRMVAWAVDGAMLELLKAGLAPGGGPAGSGPAGSGPAVTEVAATGAAAVENPEPDGPERADVPCAPCRPAAQGHERGFLDDEFEPVGDSIFNQGAYL